MRILQITLAFPPCYTWGGPVKTTYLTCKELVRRGHNVTVYCSNLINKHVKLFPETTEKEIDGIRVVYFNALNLPFWPGTLGPVWLLDLPARIKREINEFDVIHINGYRNIMQLPVSHAARKAGVPFIVQPHGSMPVIMNSFVVKRLYDRLLGRRELEGIAALVALQEAERQQALSHGVPDEKIVIIPNGVDLDEPSPAVVPGVFRQKYGIGLDRPMILFLARINRKKGADMLVEAFARVRTDLNAVLVIAGPDDGQLAEVNRMIDELNIRDRVVLPGLLDNGQALNALNDADLFVLPCRTDTFPMAIVEACMMKTPMVITDRCEIADMVQERVADITPFEAGLFGRAMERLLTDRARYERYQEACPKFLKETFSLKTVVDQVEELYGEVVKD